MLLPNQAATLNLSFCDFAPGVGQAAGGAVASLVRFLTDHHLAATWATDCPATWPHAALVAAEQPRQELAVLADEGWSSAGTPRTEFGTALGRRAQAARDAGLAVSTLYVPGPALPYGDLLVKHGISAVGRLSIEDAAQPAAGILRLFRPAVRAASAGPWRNLRWGLWEMPPAIDPLRVGPRRSRQALRGAAGGGVAHLRVDLAALIDGGRRCLAQLDSVLRLVVELRDSRELESRTAAATVAMLARRRVNVAACSILRRAA